MGKQVKKWLVFALLALTALVVAEQLLLKFLDWRAKWDDEAFKAYLANPGPRNELSTRLYDCQYHQIAWFYRYRICIHDLGAHRVDSQNVERPIYTLEIVGTTGYLSLIPEEGGDRATWDASNIWVVDDNLRFLEDMRQRLPK
jgi:hypothetical protein